MTTTKTRDEKKLSVLAIGCWRNKFWTFQAWHPEFLDDADTLLDAQTVLSGFYPTEQEAREAADALREERENDAESGWNHNVIFLGPVFFPD